MNHKVLGSVFVLAVALGIVSVTLRTPQMAPDFPPPARVAASPAEAATNPRPAKAQPKNMARALASYRIYETGIERGMDFRGAGFTAQVAEDSVRFGNTEGSIFLGTPRFEQGSRPVETAAPRFEHPAFGVARLERGPVTEEYLFENRRMEQIFRIPAPLGEGALKIRVPLAANFPAVMETRPPGSGSFGAAEFRDGGVAVMDATGALKFHCTGAVAYDAADRRITLELRHENGEIAMVVPASFMDHATYPVVVDPWFGSNGSNVGGGISNTAGASERPSYKDNVIAWADNSTGNFEIYVKAWNGFNFAELAGSATGGGISANPGMSINPTVISDLAGAPTVAWEDTSGGAFSIYLKQFSIAGNSWNELAGSASKLGLNSSFGTASHPSLGLLSGLVPGTVTTDQNNNVVSTTPPTSVKCPVVAWDSGGSNSPIFVAAFYPGAPGIPQIGATPAVPAVPAGWYLLGAPNGNNVTPLSQSFSGYSPGTGEFPVLVVDGLNQVTVAWHSTVTGNYEIFATRWTLPGVLPATGNVFMVTGRPIPNPLLDMQPPSNFLGIASGGAPDNVSNTANPSQYPSICIDSLGGISIAWQETESIAGPYPAPPFPVGTTFFQTSQIHLLRSTGGAWTAVAGSNSPGGISRTGLAYAGALTTPNPTPGDASFPSVDAGGNYIGVAWEDTSNSRSSIYIRRAAIPGGATWDNVGFQGSAFPPLFFGEIAPIGGVSQSPNFALHPQIQMNVDGSPSVAWADGSGSTFDILYTSFWPNGPGVAVGMGTNNPTFQLTVRQTDLDPADPLSVDVPFGGFTQGTSIWLSSRVFTETLVPAGSQLWLEFEIQPAGVPFTLTPTHQATFVTPDSPTATPALIAKLKFDGLPNTNYHYITRSIDQQGRFSPWFEQTNTGGVSFRVNASASQGGTGGSNTAAISVGNTPHKGNCGLLGLEAVAALGLIRLLRRRRSK